MNLKKFEEMYQINTTTGKIRTRPILLNIDRAISFSPFTILSDNVVIDYTKAKLINGENINLAISFYELTKRFSI